MQLLTFPLCLGVFVLVSFTPHLRIILETLREAQVMIQLWYGENWYSRFRWPRCLRRESSVTRLLGLWVRIPPGAWMFVVCCVLSGRGLCDGPIPRLEEFYCVCVCVCLSLSVISCNHNSLLLGWIDRRGRLRKKEEAYNHVSQVLVPVPDYSNPHFHIHLTLSWPAGRICPTYKESFQVC
jgi:hypothetical protein